MAKLAKGVRQFVYIGSLRVFEMPKKRLDIGERMEIDGTPYEVWYVEETHTLRNVRVEVLN